MAIELIDEAVQSGARVAPACHILGITTRTLRRWRAADDLADGRAAAARARSYPQALTAADDNPYSEALFRTLKYTPAYPDKPFADIDAARLWVQRFVTWYNTEHRHSGIRFVTPYERHYGLDQEILACRHAVYEKAKHELPQRWKGRNTRDWSHEDEVWLNPPKEHDGSTGKQKLAA